MTSQTIGMQIGATTSPAELGSVVAEVERLGYGEIWLAEDYFELGGIASAATALAATEEIRIGLGVVAASARHPAVTAMEFAALRGAFPGRFRAGLGHGAPGWIRQMGLQAASPLGSLREATASVRRLLDGETVSRSGAYFHFDRVSLTHPAGNRIPIYLGVHGPASLRLSGELADGTLLGWFSSPSYVAWARDRIDEGRAEAGRTDHHELVALCLLSLSDHDPESARRQIGTWAAPILKAMVKSPQVEASPLRNDLMALVEQESETETDPALPDRVLDEFAAAGDTGSCAAMVDRLLDAGADRVVMVPNPAGFRSTGQMVDQIHAAVSLLGRRGGDAGNPAG